MTPLVHTTRRGFLGVAALTLLWLSAAWLAPPTGKAQSGPTRQVQAQFADEAARLVVIVMPDLSRDDAVPCGFPHDAVNVESNIARAFDHGERRSRLVLHRVPRETCTPQGLCTFVRGLDIRRTDAVLCYMSSHGGWDPVRGRYLFLGQGGSGVHGHVLLLSELEAALRVHEPHAVFLVPDCCSTLAHVPVAEVPSHTRSAVETQETGPIPMHIPACWETVRALFLRQPRGTVVELAAASRGTPSRGRNGLGGAFSIAWLQLLSQPLDSDLAGHAAWQAFFSRLQRDTNRVCWQHFGTTQVPELVRLGVGPAPSAFLFGNPPRELSIPGGPAGRSGSISAR